MDGTGSVHEKFSYVYSSILYKINVSRPGPYRYVATCGIGICASTDKALSMYSGVLQIENRTIVLDSFPALS